MFAEYIRQALLVVFVVSIIPLFLSSAVSLLFAVIQSATQIQEQSIGHLVKLLTLGAVYFAGGSYFCSLMVRFFTESFQSVSLWGGIAQWSSF